MQKCNWNISFSLSHSISHFLSSFLFSSIHPYHFDSFLHISIRLFVKAFQCHSFIRSFKALFNFTSPWIIHDVSALKSSAWISKMVYIDWSLQRSLKKEPFLPLRWIFDTQIKAFVIQLNFRWKFLRETFFFHKQR